MPAPTIFTACTLCGGTAGTPERSGSAHELCKALQANGLPTPSLGDRCSTCRGSGVKPGATGGAMLFFDLGPAAIKRSIEAQFPSCPTCRGSRVQPGTRAVVA